MNDKELAEFVDYARRTEDDTEYWRAEAGKWQTKYEQLQQIYNKLADQWNAIQATARPDNRNLQRAEGAGEMARLLAEVLLGVAYSKEVSGLLRRLLDDMERACGQEVAVNAPVVRRG